MLEGHEIVAIEQDDAGITVTARDVDTGQEKRLRGKYLIGADGAHSKVRDLLGIEFDGRGVFSNSITIYFQADLWPQLGGKPLSRHLHQQPGVRRLLPAWTRIARTASWS